MELMNLIGLPERTYFKKGDILFLQDNPSEGLYYLLQGTAKLYSLHRNGHETIYHLISPGEFIGISSLIGHRNHLYSAKAMEDIQCCYFSKEDLHSKLLPDPKISRIIFQKLGKLIDDILQRQARLTRSGVKKKMADCLDELATDFGEEDPEGIRIKLQMSREELASLLGVAPETAIRFISDFKRKGIITEEDRHLIIRDRDSLRQISEE